MSLNYNFTVADRFLKYVTIDTQSDPHSEAQPSTEKQKDLSRLLVEELHQMGISDAHLDEHGYVYATVPSTSEKNVPVVSDFISPNRAIRTGKRKKDSNRLNVRVIITISGI